jgi:hypothetical protein
LEEGARMIAGVAAREMSFWHAVRLVARCGV